MRAARSIAVVIPTLDESDRVAAAVASAAHDVPAAGRGAAPIEVVVVDGGSRDDTLGAARSAGARVLSSEPGRGRQLDLGWRATRAEAVLFLHADTVLPVGWRDAVEAALADESVAGGAFRLRFDERGAIWRALEWGVALRVGLFGLPYGDQAIFVRRGVLEASGGVPHVAILEDLDLVRSIKRSGRLRLVPAVVSTSARRHGAGVVSTVSKHALALGGWLLGLDRGWIARQVRG